MPVPSTGKVADLVSSSSVADPGATHRLSFFPSLWVLGDVLDRTEAAIDDPVDMAGREGPVGRESLSSAGGPELNLAMFLPEVDVFDVTIDEDSSE